MTISVRYRVHFVSFASLDNPGAYGTLSHGEGAQPWMIEELKRFLAEKETELAARSLAGTAGEIEEDYSDLV